MRLLSIQHTGVQLGNSSSPETHWKAFLLKINPVRPRPASQPCRPCAACRLASPSPLIHCSVPFMQKPSYGCARAGTGAFKPPATHALSLRHTQTKIKTQRKHIHTVYMYINKGHTNSFPCMACSWMSQHCTSWGACSIHYIGKCWTYELASHKPIHMHTVHPIHHISHSMIGLQPSGKQGQITKATGLDRVTFTQ